MTKIQTLLGFAAKAGDLVSGSTTVEVGIKRNHVKLVILAKDLSPKTIKNFSYLSLKNNIPFYIFGSIDELGIWVGSPGRGVVGVTSTKFAAAICSLLKDGGEEP